MIIPIFCIVLNLSCQIPGDFRINNIPFFDDFNYTDTPGGYNWREDWIRATWTMNHSQMGESRAVPENGVMKITVTGGSPFQGGCIQTRETGFSYGRWDARLKAPSEPGVVAAMFTMDWNNEKTETDGDGTHQEVDIEFLPYTFGENSGQVHFAIHAKNRVNHFAKDISLDFNPSKDFHVWSLEILPDRVNWYVDDSLLQTYTMTAR